MERTNRPELLQLRESMADLLNREARSSLFRFTAATMPTFAPAPFHRSYYGMLQDFADGRIRKLMVFMPPQHGKSEGSTRRLPAYLLGRDPDLRLAVVSYSATKARKFNREIQNVIDSEEYRGVFPDTTLAGRNSIEAVGSYARNSDECEIVGHRGGFKTVGVCGPLTGDPVDVLIMDDIYKDARSAWSNTIRGNIEDWYDTVAETRLHNGSRQLMVFTRWHREDLAGHLLNQQGRYDPVENPDGWVVVNFPAIKVGGPTEYDPREEGEALWPERHSRRKLEDVRRRIRLVFECLYQGDPQPLEGLMYDEPFREYERIPASRRRTVKAYIDTADRGADYLCCIIYVETETANYVLDVLYTQKGMTWTETRVAELLTKYRVERCIIEGNNGGDVFRRNVEDKCRIMGNDDTRFTSFMQTQNKERRIYENSGRVMNLVQFPAGWDRLFPAFYTAVAYYSKVGGNEHDDAPDALTGTVEFRRKGPRVNAAEYL